MQLVQGETVVAEAVAAEFSLQALYLQVDARWLLVAHLQTLYLLIES